MIVPSYLVFGGNPEILSNLIGFCYPMFLTREAFQLGDVHENILTYWITFACFWIGDTILPFITSWYWLYKVIIE